MTIYLKITENGHEDRVRLTHRPFFIGRSSKCHKTLTDNMISGRHLAVKISGDVDRVVVKDLETTNGTYLNGSKVQESFLYLDDFIQIGKVTIELDDSEMSAKELALHKRDYEKTNVTFVKMGTQIDGVDDFEEDEQGHIKQKNLLAKIRQKQVQNNEDTQATRIDDEAEELLSSEIPLEESKAVKNKKKAKQKRKKGDVKQDSAEDGLVGKLKGLFKK